MRKRYVTFSLAGGRYCIPVEQVLQILRLEDLIEIPKPPPFIEGVINLRGDIIPVVSLRTRLEVTGGERGGRGIPEQRKRRVVIIRVDGKPYGLDVDEVREIVEIDEEGITTDATTMFGVRADFLLGIARRDEGVYLVLDLPRVLGTSRELPGSLAGQSQ
jgi:purine-binding chemotaxis protein CheW